MKYRSNCSHCIKVSVTDQIVPDYQEGYIKINQMAYIINSVLLRKRAHRDISNELSVFTRLYAYVQCASVTHRPPTHPRFPTTRPSTHPTPPHSLALHRFVTPPLPCFMYTLNKKGVTHTNSFYTCTSHSKFATDIPLFMCRLIELIILQRLVPVLSKSLLSCITILMGTHCSGIPTTK